MRATTCRLVFARLANRQRAGEKRSDRHRGLHEFPRKPVCLLARSLRWRVVGGRPTGTIREIAERHGIPERYLVQILLQLKGAGLVASTRGAAGGYRLARPAASISLSEVLAAVDGPDEPSRTVNGRTGGRFGSGASLGKRPGRRTRLCSISTTIAQLAEQSSPHDWII